MIERILSGGQTGVDRAALVAAQRCGLATGGWMPKGFRAHDGNHPEFEALYGMKEHTSSRYTPRTHMNVRQSDVTIRIACDWTSSGEVLTLKAIAQYNRPHYDVWCRGTDCTINVVEANALAEWIRFHGYSIINVSGNSEKSAPGIQRWSTDYLTMVFLKLSTNPKILVDL